jgi:hypothetical protein
MKKYLLLLFFFVAFTALKSQSKKEQIEALNYRIDSLSSVISNECILFDNQIKEYSLSIFSLKSEIQSLKKSIKSLEDDKQSIEFKLSKRIQYLEDSLGIFNIKKVVINSIYCNGNPTAIVDVTNPKTGKTWMDRNLGAKRAAISPTDEAAYGDLYQWGRAADGHQCRNSIVISTLSNTDQPTHGKFIYPSSGYTDDWRSPRNDNLWQGVNGVNNPCPKGYRLPTINELEEEMQSWNSAGALGAFGSPLKLTMAGSRHNNVVSGYGSYWSSSVNYTSVWHIFIGNESKIGDFYLKQESTGIIGKSVRCIKD